MKNKILAYLLTIGFLLGNLGSSIVFVRAEEEAVFLIRSEEDYYRLAAFCTLDSWSEGKTVLLETDLEFTNSNAIKPIPYFKGTFDGQGHTVRGFFITADGSVQGLFRYIGEGGLVGNLNVIGTVSPQGSSSTVGGIAGENRGTITNCTFAGVIKGNSTAGGIAGSNEASGVISGCRISGIVRGNHYVGGIAGKNGGTIENCTNKGNINIYTEEAVLNLEYINLDNLRSTENTANITDIGGIAGYSNGKVESCVNEGKVGYQHVGYNVGGITGRQSGYVNNCVNYGAVYGRKDIGGINGQMEPYNTLIFSETTLSKLDRQFDDLQGKVDTLIDDADSYSDTVTGRLSDMRAQITNAQNSVEDMMNQIEAVVNTDTDTLNDLSGRISDTIEKMVPVSTDLTNASSRLKSAVGNLREAVENIEEAADISQDGVRYVEKALAEMEDAQAGFEMAAAPLNGAGESFQNALLAFTDALKLLADGEGREKAEEKAKEGTAALKKGMDELSAAGKCIRSGMEDISDALSAVHSAIPYFQDTANPIGRALRDTDESLSEVYRMSSFMREAIAGIERALEDLAEKEGLSFARLEDFDRSRESLSDSVAEIADILNFINTTAADKNGRIGNDIQAVSDQLFAIIDTIKEAFEGNGGDKDYIEDISFEDTGEQTEGKTAACVNYGAVEGDVNVGGITGSMAIEYDFDPEDDIKTEGESSRNFIYQTRAVIRSCRNNGEITAKKNGAGGIVGSMDLGSVISCYSYGSVASTGGRYTGGIAGYSGADIRRSYAKCTLSGNDYVGGIAGLGQNIRQCFSLVLIKEGDEYIGAIAGNVDGELEGNYFVNEALAGMDGVSYAAKAEPMAYQDFIALEGIPEEFLSFRLTFLAKDEVIYETAFSYGADLSGIELPAIPKQEGSYAVWEDTEYSRMVFDTTVHAVYKDNITALESAQKRKELPVLLVEGSFGGKDRLSLCTAEADSADLQGSRLLESWKLEIPQDGNATHRIQYLIPDKASGAEIEYRTADGWRKADADTDGKYLVWEAEGQELVFRSIDRQSGTTFLHAAAGAAVIAAGIVIIYVVIQKTRKNRSKKTEEEEKAAESE